MSVVLKGRRAVILLCIWTLKIEMLICNLHQKCPEVKTMLHHCLLWRKLTLGIKKKFATEILHWCLVVLVAVLRWKLVAAHSRLKLLPLTPI